MLQGGKTPPPHCPASQTEKRWLQNLNRNPVSLGLRGNNSLFCWWVNGFSEPSQIYYLKFPKTCHLYVNEYYVSCLVIIWEIQCIICDGKTLKELSSLPDTFTEGQGDHKL